MNLRFSEGRSPVVASASPLSKPAPQRHMQEVFWYCDAKKDGLLGAFKGCESRSLFQGHQRPPKHKDPRFWFLRPKTKWIPNTVVCGILVFPLICLTCLTPPHVISVGFRRVPGRALSKLLLQPAALLFLGEA